MPQRRPKRTEKTAKGLDVRIPKRGEFMANLKKVGAAKPPPRRKRSAPPV